MKSNDKHLLIYRLAKENGVNENRIPRYFDIETPLIIQKHPKLRKAAKWLYNTFFTLKPFGTY